MGWIKPKVGNCIDCPPNEELKPLQAKRCISGPYYHYHNFKRSEASKKKQVRDKIKRDRIAAANNGNTQAQWYADQIKIMPTHCEECGEYLTPYNLLGMHVYAAHIVPKRSFESVCVDPNNCMFFCGDCHTNYDQKDSEYILAMRSWPVIISRFNMFKNKIIQKEISGLQDCFVGYLK